MIATDDYRFLADLLKRGSGLSLGEGKEYLLESRLPPVATRHGFADVAALVRGLRANPQGDIVKSVCDAMTTGETLFFRDTAPFQAFSVDVPACNNWADIGLPEVYGDPDLASFNGATAQTSPSDDTHLVKQAVGVFASAAAAGAAYHRIVDRTAGCSGQTATMRIPGPWPGDTVEVWSFTGGPAGPADAAWVKQEAGTDRRCFTQTRLRGNVLLQAKVCQSGNGGPAVNVLAGAMQNILGQ